MWNYITGRTAEREAQQALVSAALRAERAETVRQIHDIEVQAEQIAGADTLMMRHLARAVEVAGRGRKVGK
ncbi:hypothetical protein [Methylobacterium sp. WSM2598]|uniref:hypothetical protein n=1 Tax=Methylobacterium sp. WSM2598 TaxID=398261 RepID=UPI00036B5A4F|nr:hypothetical protein [Methylobacterium sp. WSM2598]